MQRFSILAALAASAAAYQVKINNNCGKPAYIWSCGDAVGDMFTLESGAEPWTEDFYSKDGGAGGPSIYVSDGKSHTSGNIAQLEYYWQPDIKTVWWDLSIIDGDPFGNEAVSLGSDLTDIPYAACKPVQCSGVGKCQAAYRTHEQLAGTHDCPPSNLIMNLCDANGNFNAGSSGSGSSSPAPVSSPAAVSTPAPSPSSTPVESPVSTPVQAPSSAPVAQSSEAPQPATTAAPSLGNSYLQESDDGKPIVHTAYATTVVTQVVSVQAPAPSPDGVYVGSDNMVHGKREAHAHAHAHGHQARAHNSRLFRRHNHA